MKNPPVLRFDDYRFRQSSRDYFETCFIIIIVGGCLTVKN